MWSLDGLISFLALQVFNNIALTPSLPCPIPHPGCCYSAPNFPNPGAHFGPAFIRPVPTGYPASEEYLLHNPVSPSATNALNGSTFTLSVLPESGVMWFLTGYFFLCTEVDQKSFMVGFRRLGRELITFKLIIFSYKGSSTSYQFCWP